MENKKTRESESSRSSSKHYGHREGRAGDTKYFIPVLFHKLPSTLYSSLITSFSRLRTSLALQGAKSVTNTECRLEGHYDQLGIGAMDEARWNSLLEQEVTA